jgi:hypothetical protein
VDDLLRFVSRDDLPAVIQAAIAHEAGDARTPEPCVRGRRTGEAHRRVRARAGDP